LKSHHKLLSSHHHTGKKLFLVIFFFYINFINFRPEVQIQGQDGHIYKGRIDAKLTVEVKKPIKNSNQLHINSHNSLSANNLNGFVERPNSVPNRPPSSKYLLNNNNSNSPPANNNNGNDNDQTPVYTN
jgi:hypothetical protein